MPFRPSVADDEGSEPPLVLIAEREAELRHLLDRLLREASYQTAFAADGIDVLAAVSRLRPALLLLDAELGWLDGTMALQLIRAVAGDLPIVLVACLTGAGLRLTAERLGAVAVLRKPFRNAELLQAVAHGLARGGRPSVAAPAGDTQPQTRVETP